MLDALDMFPWMFTEMQRSRWHYTHFSRKKTDIQKEVLAPGNALLTLKLMSVNYSIPQIVSYYRCDSEILVIAVK